MQRKDADPPRECDVVVVGAGIIGLAVARELAERHDGLRVTVLEREAEIAAHQTGSSSGVIHAGVYYRPGSLKARLCVEGARDLYAYCDARGIPANAAGKLIVAADESELPRLDELERRARANGVPGLRRLAAHQIAEIEPHAAGVAALHSPRTGVVDFRAVAHALAADVEAGGGTVALSCGALALALDGQRTRVTHERGTTQARAAVSCAGAWSDRLAVAAGAAPEPRIIPFRGSFLRLRPERATLVRANVFPVPDPELPFLGAHLTRGHDGSVLLGPTALIAGARSPQRRVSWGDLRQTLAWPGTWRLARRHWRAGAAELGHAIRPRSLVAQARRLVPELRAADFSAGPVGIRAQALDRSGNLVDDFVVSRTARCVHVRNAPSPAATAALAIARLIADEVEL
jgi:2-hydroxyglutarate dehydrogenase